MLKGPLERRFYPTPPHPEFPRSEFDARIDHIKKLMERDNIDVLVCWDSRNIRYFTGFFSAHWDAWSIQPAVCVIPREKEPILVIPGFFNGVAEGMTYVNDIRAQEDPHLTERIRELPIDVAQLIKDLGQGNGRIGYEGGRLGGMGIPRPANDILEFQAALKDAAHVPAGDLIWECRIIKSTAEIEAISVATESVVEALGELVANFRVGMTEREVGILMMKKALEKAHDLGTFNMRCSQTRYPMVDTPPIFDAVPICKGDRMVLELLPTYKGYRGSCCRVFQVGELSKEARSSVDIVEAGQSAAIDAICAGVTTGTISGAVQKVFHDAGLNIEIEMVGHGVGLTGHEPPMLTAREETELQEGMVLAVEVWKYDVAGFEYGDSKQASKNLGPFGNEDLVVVTRGGCDRLPAFRKDILSLPYNP